MRAATYHVYVRDTEGLTNADPIEYTLRVTADTKYIGFDGPLTLAEFRTAVADVQQTDTGEYTTAVTVTYNIETEFVTSIGIHRNAYQWPEIAD